MNKQKNFVSAVVYVHNQERIIGGFLQQLFRTLDENFEKFEIICVNDASTDDSVREIEKVADTFEHMALSILHMSYFQGIEAAMNAGVDLSIGDFVYEFDSVEMNYDNSLIMEVYQKSLEGFDIVSAIPDKKQKLSSRLFYRIFNRFTFDQLAMRTESFRILSRRVINRVKSMNISVPYRKAAYANCGLAGECVIYPVIGKKKQKTDRIQQHYRRNLATDSLILLTDLGYHCSLAITIAMMLIALGIAMYTVIVFCMGISVAGWTTMMLFLSIGFFALFAILTIIVKYLAVLVNMIFKKQRYRISNIQKITK